MTDPMERIAAALERLAPAPLPHADATAHPAYGWDGTRLFAVSSFRPQPLDRLIGLDAQRAALRVNLERLASGAAAHDVLLWGARGTGKSALVNSLTAALQAEGRNLALVEVTAARLDTLPALFALIAGAGRAFVLFIDDLGFENAGESRAFRSMLEGGAAARPDHARFVVTANRRHLIPRDLAEQESAINPRDSIDDNLALADRFGLSLGFHAIDQATYLAIVATHAAALGLGTVDEGDALGFATRRGGRSGRVAHHYVVDLAGRQGKRA